MAVFILASPHEFQKDQIFYKWLVPKLVEAGGGGPIENTELWRCLGPEDGEGNPRPWKVHWGSIIHSNAAKSYTNLPYDPPQLNKQATDEENDKTAGPSGVVINQADCSWAGEEDEVKRCRVQLEAENDFHVERRVPAFAQKYRTQRYAATHIVHSPKPGLRRGFCKLVRVRLHDGRLVWVKAGTQGIDGEWTTTRNVVSRRPISTMRTKVLNRNLRVHQWKRWQGLHVDKLPLLGRALKRGRELFRQEQPEALAELLDSHKAAKALVAERNRKIARARVTDRMPLSNLVASGPSLTPMSGAPAAKSTGLRRLRPAT